MERMQELADILSSLEGDAMQGARQIWQSPVLLLPDACWMSDSCLLPWWVAQTASSTVVPLSLEGPACSFATWR